MWVPPFGNLRIKGCLLLTVAYRSLHVLHRLEVPRHPPCALSSLTVKLTREQRRQFQISNLRSQISLSSRANLSVHLHSKTCLVFLCRYSIVKEPTSISDLKSEI